MHTTTRHFGLFLSLLARLTLGSPLLPPRGIDTGMTPASGSNSLLAKRDYTEIICGFYSTADKNDVGVGLADEGDDQIPVDRGSCNRVGCYDTR